MSSIGSGRTLRDRKPPKVQANRQTVINGFNGFEATIGEVGKGGGNDTTAILQVAVTKKEGSSKNSGHAEMGALNELLKTCGSNLDTLMAKGPKTVECTSKPVCYRCAVVLGLLGFKAKTNATKKTRSGMGQTQWVLPSPLKEKSLKNTATSWA